MKILLLGKNGQLGWELRRSLAGVGEVIALNRGQADFCDLENLSRLLAQYAPQFIVNAAAYTSVDEAQHSPERAILINGRAPALLADWAAKNNAWLIHYSTDYVFDGTKDGPYREDDAPAPLNVYGQSKLLGDEAIRNSNSRHIILRTGWVFGVRGNNFARTILGLAARQNKLSIVNDQFGSPTSAQLLADISALLIYRISGDANSAALSGLYNLCAQGFTTWYEYGRYLLENASKLGGRYMLGAADIIPVAGKDFPRPAPRPANSRLDNGKLKRVFGLQLPPWQYHVDIMLESWTQMRGEL